MGFTGKHPLDSLLYPRSVAVIGASDAVSKWGGRVLTYLVNYGFKGTIYPVNNKYDQVLGLPCYADLKALPEAPDIVVMAVPARFIYDLVAQCCEIGVRNAVIITSGFAEVGEAGRVRQEEIKKLAREANLRMVGPNCLGIISSSHRMALTASLALAAGVLLEGSIGFVSQSGAMAGSFLNRAQDRGIGLRYMVSTGNEVDLELSEFIEYLADDPATSVIVTFIEGVRNPPRFLAAADRALQAGKPIVALKVGRSERGSKAARSHTAALTGYDSTYDAIFKQKGIIRVDTFDGLLDTALLLSKAKPTVGPGLGVISSSGGACGLISDRSTEIGVPLSDLGADTAMNIAQAMGLETVQNPVDLLSQQSSDPQALAKIIEAYDADRNVAAILTVLTTMPGLEATGQALAAYARTNRKPVIVLSTAGCVADEAIRIMEAADIPVFSTMDECLKAIRGWLWRSRFVAETRVNSQASAETHPVDVEAIRASLRGRDRPLTEPEAKRILAAYGIPTTREEVVTTAQQAAQVARKLGFPVALKVVSPDIAHKTEAGGIRLGLKSEEAVIAAFNEIVAGARAFKPGAIIDGVLVQEMVTDGLETIVGMSRDTDFGPVIVFGLGGIFVEVLRDVAHRLPPISRWDAAQMAREIKSHRVLEGVRGQRPRDVAAIEDVLVKMSRLVCDLGDLVDEIDLNPLMVLAAGNGAKVVDALIIPRRTS